MLEQIVVRMSLRLHMVCPAIILTDSIPSMPATESIKQAQKTKC